MILVRIETSPEDFHGMVAAQAILTARGGMTSHAAVVARGMGKPCVAGCGRAAASTTAPAAFTVDGTIVEQGRLDHARRLDRRGLRRAAPTRSRP